MITLGLVKFLERRDFGDDGMLEIFCAAAFDFSAASFCASL
jgi:hypothetical protein